MRIRSIALALAASAGVLFVPSGALRADDEKSTQLLMRIYRQYAMMSTYADHGVITIDMRIGEEHTTQSINFVTAFDAPGRFRYDQWYTSPDGRLHEIVLWLEGGEPRVWRTQRIYSDETEVIELESREEAYTEAARGSGGRDNLVPRFLMARGGSSLIFNLENIRTEGETTLDGVKCVFLSGKFVNGARLRLVVGKEDLLIRRAEIIRRPEMHVLQDKIGEEAEAGVVRAGGLQRARVKTIVEYFPRTDVYFVPGDLDFDPIAERAGDRGGAPKVISSSAGE